MAFGAPRDVPASTDERQLLLGYLQLQRELVVSATVGVSAHQARWPPDGRLLSLSGIVNPLVRVGGRWIGGSFSRQGVGVWRSEEEFTVGPERTLAEVIDRK